MVMMAGGGGAGGSMDEHERKVVTEFYNLLEKSKQLFNGLRDLPQYGHKQWQAYFGRTFDIYTKLWKYQQQHRYYTKFSSYYSFYSLLEQRGW